MWITIRKKWTSVESLSARGSTILLYASAELWLYAEYGGAGGTYVVPGGDAGISPYFRQRRTSGEPGAEECWLMGRGWNQDYFADGRRFPTRWDLDEVSRVRPICIIRACGHCCVVNSRALELMGVTKETQQPEGGFFEKDPDGELNGIFRENAVEYVFRRIPAPSQDQIRKMMRRAVKKLNAYGVTSCQTDDFMTLPVPYEQVIRAYQELEEGELTVRVNEQAQFTDPKELQWFLNAGWNTGTGSTFFRIGPLKIVGDGSLGIAHCVSEPFL